MLGILGDVHCNWAVINMLSEMKFAQKIDAVIQVGDFGFYPDALDMHWKKPPFPVYAIDGNHEHFPMLRGIDRVTEIKPNLFFVPRGTILELAGYRIGLCGGGESVDKAWRRENYDWFADERVTHEQIERLYGSNIDFLVTHVPPRSLIDKAFPPINLESWGLPHGWVDVSAVTIEYLWNQLNQPPMFCGHMHHSVDGSKYGMKVRILNIDEIHWIQPKVAPSAMAA